MWGDFLHDAAVSCPELEDLFRAVKVPAYEVDFRFQVLPYPFDPCVVDPEELHGAQFLCIIAGHLSNLPGLQQEEGPFLPLFYDNGISF